MTRARLGLALALAHAAACAALALADKPTAWAMFARVERLDFALEDKDGRPLDPWAFVPPSRYLNTAEDLRRVAAFACRTRPALAPLTLRVAGAELVFAAPGCDGR